MPILRIYALGRPRVLQDQTPVDFPTQKTRDLCYLLLFHAGEMVERDWIAERLWPMRPPGRARRCLSTTLWRLRKTLQRDDAPAEGIRIRTERDALLLERGKAYWLDVDAFERKATAGLQGSSLPCDESAAEALVEAVDLYQGDLLEGCYDDWLLAERERLRLLLLRVLRRLQRHTRLSGDFEAGVAYAERLLCLDSLQEDVHREVMRCHADAGHPTRALNHFRRCRQMLNSELRVEPMPETWRLYHQIRAQRRLSPSEGTPGGPMSVESALTQLDRAMRALRRAQVALETATVEFGRPQEAPDVTLIWSERD